MSYDMEKIELSQRIFTYLYTHGQLKEKDEEVLYKAYVEDDDVLKLIKSQAKLSDCQIERYGSVIYLMPNVTNTVFGYTKAELKKELCKSNATDKDYYLSQFIIITLMAEFYDGQGIRCKSRDFIKAGELQNLVSERLKIGVQNEEKMEQENIDDTNKITNGLDYKSMSQAFECLNSDDRKSKKKTTKEGIMNSILCFLEKQGLITYVIEDEMITTTKKLDDIMEMKILNMDNYEMVMKALK